MARSRITIFDAACVQLTQLSSFQLFSFRSDGTSSSLVARADGPSLIRKAARLRSVNREPFSFVSLSRINFEDGGETAPPSRTGTEPYGPSTTASPIYA